MSSLSHSSQVVLSVFLVVGAGACSSDEDPVTGAPDAGGAAGSPSAFSGGTSTYVIATSGGTVTSSTSPFTGGAGGTGAGGTVISTSTSTTTTNGGVAGASTVQYAGDGSILRGGQGGTNATTSSGFAGLPVKRCRRNQDCAGFSSSAYLCFIPAVVSGCDEGPLGYCTGPATPHCGLNSVYETCGSCLMRPDGVQWDLPAASRVVSAMPNDWSVSCSYCTLPSSGGAAGSPGNSGPSCSDYLRNAAGNAGIAGCSADSAGSGGAN